MRGLEVLRPRTVALISACRGVPGVCDNVSDNLNFVSNVAAYALLVHGVVPVIPHLMYRGMIDEDNPEQREVCLLASLRLMLQCDAAVVLGHVTPGMEGEIEALLAAGVPVHIMGPEYMHMNPWADWRIRGELSRILEDISGGRYRI